MTKKSLISFIDASGTFDSKDRFFGVGMLTVDNPGKLTDKLHLIYQRVLTISQRNREKVLNNLVEKKDYKTIISILKKSYHFELKFDRITPIKIPYYKEIIRLFLNNSKLRFSAMVIDKKKDNYNNKFFNTTWEAYTSYVATLIFNEIKNLSNYEIFLVLDEINKPKNVSLSLEETILEKIKKKFLKYDKEKICNVVNALRIESHSNLLMQLTDIILGAVMYDFKDKFGLLSQKLKNKKEEVVRELRDGFGVESLAFSFTKNKPVYFNVWEVEFKKSGGSDK
jgi:hypothetical protein